EQDGGLSGDHETEEDRSLTEHQRADDGQHRQGRHVQQLVEHGGHISTLANGSERSMTTSLWEGCGCSDLDILPRPEPARYRLIGPGRGWQTPGMSLHTSTVDIQTRDGVADGFVAAPDDGAEHPAVLFYMDAFGPRPRLEEMAGRLAEQGYVVLVPNVFYRHG